MLAVRVLDHRALRASVLDQERGVVARDVRLQVLVVDLEHDRELAVDIVRRAAAQRRERERERERFKVERYHVSTNCTNCTRPRRLVPIGVRVALTRDNDRAQQATTAIQSLRGQGRLVSTRCALGAVSGACALPRTASSAPYNQPIDDGSSGPGPERTGTCQLFGRSCESERAPLANHQPPTAVSIAHNTYT